IVLGPGTVGDVALDPRPAVLDGVAAFAETVEVLVRGRGPASADAEDRRRRAFVACLDLDDALAGGTGAQGERSPLRIVRLHGRMERATLAGHGRGGRRLGPDRRGPPRPPRPA